MKRVIKYLLQFSFIAALPLQGLAQGDPRIENITPSLKPIAEKAKRHIVVETAYDTSKAGSDDSRDDTARVSLLAVLCARNNAPADILAALRAAVYCATVHEYVVGDVVVICQKNSDVLKDARPFEQIVELPAFKGTMEQLCEELKKQGVNLSACHLDLFEPSELALTANIHNLDLPPFRGTIRDLLIQCSRSGATTCGYYSVYFPGSKAIAVDWMTRAPGRPKAAAKGNDITK